MPLHGHDSYSEVMDEFLAHWALVDDVLPPGAELVVQGAVSRGVFAGMAAELRGKSVALHAQGVEQRVAARDVSLQRGALLEALGALNGTVRAWWAGLPEAELVPGLPVTGSALDRVLRLARQALRLWDRINAGPAPGGVVLPLLVGPAPGLDRAGFAALMAGVESAREGLEEAEFATEALRAERNALEVPVQRALGAYVRAVPVRLGGGHALLHSLPRLRPLPGHTPKPVPLHGEWSREDAAARLEWEASDDATLDHYQIRWCPGETYNKKEESVALTIPASGVRTALVRAGLEVPGAVACYKVYVVLKTGNERGSASVLVRAGE